ncbi:DUF4365 domain-containing protein [Cupriavidus taiwanensis]|uniref:DUF4365 domain-containing protein n=1 Tax=Cupriavidus taiwanensis TaxID=164546 RepID=A0A375BXN9_9BURK|nr:conserved hypothetical protein [Cupriavidus taiwanensis]
MKLPTRIKQHKAESDSYAILVYKLRHIGIFRNVTESDYGVDFEVEIVHEDQVTGRYFKAQVKSSENLKVRKKDRIPVVGGIKESTLYYWTELSYKTHVILYAVDLNTEEIHVSRPIFWQAASLINGDDKSKTIEFLPEIAKTEEHKVREMMPAVFTLWFAHSPSLPDLIYSHKTALRYLKLFLGLYVDVYHYDAHVEIHEPDVLKTLLDTCRVLLWDKDFKATSRSETERKHLYSFDYWVKNSGEWATDEVTNFSAQTPVRVLIPSLVEELKVLRRKVFASKYYWRLKDRPYLRLVYETVLPGDTSNETLRKWGYDFDRHQGQVISFSLFETIKFSELKEKTGIEI